MAHEKIGYMESNMIRMQRSISWLLRDLEMSGEKGYSDDISFILHWIAFEALYGREQNISMSAKGSSSNGVVKEIMTFMTNLEKNETDRQSLINAIHEVWKDVKLLYGNQYINPACWAKYYHGPTKAGKNHNAFASNNSKAKLPTKKGLNDNIQLNKLLKELFQRLYQMRNQIFHGNATHKGSKKHERATQIASGSRVMHSLMPELIHILLEDMEMFNDSKRWGRVPYPRIRNSKPKA